MKKFLSIIMVLIICSLCLCGCQSGGKDRDDDDNEDTRVEKFDAEKVISQLEVTEYKSSENSQLCLLFDNGSDFDISLSCTVTTYDSEGTVVEVVSNNVEYFEHATEAVLDWHLEEYNSFKYELSVKETNSKRCMTSKLQHKITEGNGEVFITVTNTFEEDVDGASGHLLLFNGDEFIGVNYINFERDFGLDAGESITESFSISESETFKLVLYGYVYK